jgi:hypothetical protein
MVVDIVVAKEIPNHVSEWKQAKECHEGICSAFDHYDHIQLARLRDEAWDLILDDRELSDPDDEDELTDAVDEIMAEMAGDDEERYSVCDERKINWTSLIALGNPDKACTTNAQTPGFEQYDNVSEFATLFRSLTIILRGSPSF